LILEIRDKTEILPDEENAILLSKNACSILPSFKNNNTFSIELTDSSMWPAISSLITILKIVFSNEDNDFKVFIELSKLSIVLANK